MPFGKRKKNRGPFLLSIVKIKKISSPWKPEIQLFRHFPKLKIAYINGKKILPISPKLGFTPKTF